MDAQNLADFCRFFIFIVMFMAAYGKATDMKGFAASLADGFHIPAGLSRYAAPVIACTEGLSAAGLALGHLFARMGAALALTLLLGFTAAVTRALLARREVMCRCFGRTTHALSATDLARNTLYIAAATGYLWLSRSTAVAPESALTRLSLGLAAIIIFLLSTSIQDIRRVLR